MGEEEDASKGSVFISAVRAPGTGVSTLFIGVLYLGRVASPC